MSFKFITICFLLMILIISIGLLLLFFKKKSKLRFLSLIGFSFMSILSVFGIITTISSKGLTPQHAILLSGYSSAFFNEYNTEIIESDDYVIFLDQLIEQENPNIIITVKKIGFLYKTINNDFVNYISNEYANGKNLAILSYKLENKYIHFLKFGPTYFEELGHFGYLLPNKVIINGIEVEVHSYLYCYTEDAINSINVNSFDFFLKQ